MGATEELVLKITGDSKSGEEAIKRVQQAWSSLGRYLQENKDKIRQTSEEMSRAAQVAQQFRERIQNLANAGKTLGIVFGGISAAGTKLIQSTSQVAMRNEVLAVSMYTVGERAGFARDQLDAMADGVKEMGITTSNSRLAITRMIQAELDLGKATDLARTAQNLAVISGEGSSDAFNRIMEAVTSLNPRLLRTYGIVSTTGQILGDLSDSTDATAKRQRMLDFVLEEGAKVAGVYESAMGVVGKQLTSIPRYVEEAKAALGKHFIPIIGKGADVLKTLLKWFEALPEPVQAFIARLILVGTAGSAVIAAFGGFLVLLPLIISGFTAVIGVIGPLLTIFAGLAAAIAGLIVIGRVLVSAWQQDWGGIRSAVQEAWGKIVPYLRDLVRMVREWGSAFRQQIGEIWQAVRGLLEPIFARLAALIRSINWSDLFADLKNAINVVGRLIFGLLQTIKNLLQGKGMESFAPLHDAMINVLTLIALTWQKYISRALAWGYNLVVQIAKGIIAAARAVLTAALRAIGNLVGGFLAPGSPPKEGPLSNIVKWGQGLINTYLRSFALADFGLLRESLAPIEEALRQAISAGDIDEAEFGEIFSQVREAVAGLIATFRETGEISEETLGRIAEQLGEGGEEYVKFLRLQLKHQKALDRLKAVQEEYAEAEEAGFVPKALKDKLKAAEESAEAAQEELDWQQAYLDAQQESVDIQQAMLDAMEGLTDALEDAAGSGGGLEDSLSGAGEAAEEIGEAMEGLGDLGAGLDQLQDRAGGIDTLKDSIWGFSEEFVNMRGKVEGGIAAIQNWLGLPIADKLTEIARYLTETTGIDFTGFWERVQAVLSDIDENGLLNVILKWVGIGLEYAGANWPTWAKEIGGAVLSALELAIQIQMNAAAALGTKFIEWLWSIIGALLDWVKGDHPSWGEAIAYDMGAAVALTLDLLTNKIPTWIASFTQWLGDIIVGLLAWSSSEAPKTGTTLWEHFKTSLTTWLDYMNTNLPTWIANLVEWGGDLLIAFAAGFADNAPDWVGRIKEAGAAVVEALKQGIQDAWGSLVEMWEQKLADLADMLPWSEPKDPRSPLRDLSGSGRSLVENFASGMDFDQLQAALRNQLAAVARNIEGAGIGDMIVNQNIEGGLNFPNVKDERDALGVRVGIDRRALEAGMMARTRA